MTAQQVATFRTAVWRRMRTIRAVARYNRAVEVGHPPRYCDVLDSLSIRAQRNEETALRACYAAFGIAPGLAGGRRHNDARVRVWCAVNRIADTLGH